MEIWKNLSEGYQVSNMGNFRSLDRIVTYSDGRIGNFKGKSLRFTKDAYGYARVAIDQGVKVLAHRAVAQAFIPNPKNFPYVNHKNGDKRDNRQENLEWCSPVSNNTHARDAGLNNQHGENCNLTKYSEQLVAALKRVHSKYNPSYRELSELFGMSSCQVADIIKGKTRKRG